MNKQSPHISLPVLVSFSEIAWIFVFVLIFAYIIVRGQAEKAYEENNCLKIKLEELQDQFERSEVIKKELLGLKGDFKRVAILFDISLSMKSTLNGESRWDLAKDVVSKWVHHLPFEEVVLILFNDAVKVFPENEDFANVRGSESLASRENLLAELKAVEPSGDTNTLAALEKAYSYTGIDTIILFTDGKPDVKTMPDINEQIYKLCQKHPNIPINAVGLGDYFKPELSSFLIRIAKETGGTFLGR